MKIKLILAVSILIFILASCDKNTDGIIDDNEQAIIAECNQNLLTSKLEIENNLIGEWELVGYKDGWSSTKSNPQILMMITSEKITINFESSTLKSTTEHKWVISEEEQQSGQKSFTLDFEPKHAANIGISAFCEINMYGDATARDGNMYLFEKIK